MLWSLPQAMVNSPRAMRASSELKKRRTKQAMSRKVRKGHSSSLEVSAAAEF
jgi:hypothetical protein